MNFVVNIAAWIVIAAFAVVALLCGFFFDSLILPIWFALLIQLKLLWKLLTPEWIMGFFKKGASAQARKAVMDASTHVAVYTHAPWRRKIKYWKQRATQLCMDAIARYRALPLIVQIAVAAGVFALTAGSSYAFIALLVIPQPIMNWLKTKIWELLNRTGVAQVVTKIWQKIIPESLRNRIHVYRKWHVGRQQVRLSRRIHGAVRRRRDRKLIKPEIEIDMKTLTRYLPKDTATCTAVIACALAFIASLAVGLSGQFNGAMQLAAGGWLFYFLALYFDSKSRMIIETGRSIENNTVTGKGKVSYSQNT